MNTIDESSMESHARGPEEPGLKLSTARHETLKRDPLENPALQSDSPKESEGFHSFRNYHFATRMAVRDYECDIEGIVNNAQYIHYCEHTRHLFLKACGLSFAEMHQKGVDAVVARMQLQYKVPLRPDDEFISCLSLTKESIKYVFHQDIFRADDERLCFRGKIELVCLVNGRLGDSEDYDRAFQQFINS